MRTATPSCIKKFPRKTPAGINKLKHSSSDQGVKGSSFKGIMTPHDESICSSEGTRPKSVLATKATTNIGKNLSILQSKFKIVRNVHVNYSTFIVYIS